MLCDYLYESGGDFKMKILFDLFFYFFGGVEVGVGGRVDIGREVKYNVEKLELKELVNNGCL